MANEGEKEKTVIKNKGNIKKKQVSKWLGGDQAKFPFNRFVQGSKGILQNRAEGKLPGKIFPLKQKTGRGRKD